MSASINPSLPNSGNQAQANVESRVNFSRVITWLRRSRPYYESPQSLTGTGAINPNVVTTVIAITGTPDVPFTLAAPAVNGLKKVIHLTSKGGAGNAVITPQSYDPDEAEFADIKRHDIYWDTRNDDRDYDDDGEE